MKLTCEQDHVAEATHAALTTAGVFLLCGHHANEQARAGVTVAELTPELALAART